MKKRLLITSIVMMLVVAVALSTATYAWFTSNSQVKASSINVTAATNEASALAIGWTGGNAGTLIVADDAAGVLAPMAPAHLVNLSTQDSVTFYSATVKSENSVEVFNNDVVTSVQAQDPIAPYTFKNGSASSFYIKNLSKQNTVANVALTINWGATAYEVTGDTTYQSGTTYYVKNAETGAFTALVAATDYTVGDSITGTKYIASTKDDGTDLIRVAVFVKESGESNYTLRGVLAKENATPYTATIANGTNATDGTLKVVSQGPTSQCAQVATSTSVLLLKTGTDLAANNSTLTNAASQIDVIVKVWYDGVTLNDNTAGSIANLGLQFDKANDPA